MSNFDAEILTGFFNDNKLKVSGLIFGEVWIKPLEKKLQEVKKNLQFKKNF